MEEMVYEREALDRMLCQQGALGSSGKFNEHEQMGHQRLFGSSSYVPGRMGRQILLIGADAGFFPMLNIVQNKLSKGHEGQIFLYYSGQKDNEPFFFGYLKAVAKKYSNFHYMICQFSGGDCGQKQCSNVHDVAFSNHEDLSGWKVYLYGDIDMVATAKIVAMNAEAKFSDIHVDVYAINDKKK